MALNGANFPEAASKGLAAKGPSITGLTFCNSRPNSEVISVAFEGTGKFYTSNGKG